MRLPQSSSNFVDFCEATSWLKMTMDRSFRSWRRFLKLGGFYVGLGVCLGGAVRAEVSAAAKADALFAQSSAWPMLAEWIFDRSSELAGLVSIDPVQGGGPIGLLPGVSLVADSRAPGGKAVVFDGTQKNWAGTTVLIPAKENLYLDLRFFATADGPERQTLLKLSRGPEIRLNQKSATVELIAWTVDKKWTSVRLPYVADEWSALRASIVDGVLTLEINGEVAVGRMPEGKLEVGPSRVFLGYYSERTFKGAIAYLSLRSP
ncbi:MAG: hypothetical protein RL376_1108 [Verrucomicrobiota bacterium]